MDTEAPDYDLDSEDEEWVNSQTEKQVCKRFLRETLSGFHVCGVVCPACFLHGGVSMQFMDVYSGHFLYSSVQQLTSMKFEDMIDRLEKGSGLQAVSARAETCPRSFSASFRASCRICGEAMPDASIRSCK